MFNVKLNYTLLQVVNATFFLLSFLFVRDYFHLDDNRTVQGFLILLPITLAGIWAFYTNRIFYLLVRQMEG